jgi:cell division protein FtsI/penicillin-binding protein 2
MHLNRRTFLASWLLPSLTKPASSLQKQLDEAMAQRQGSALVLDAATGKPVAQHRLAAAATRLVAPGSIIKPFVLASLIEANVIEASTRHNCERTLRISGRNLDCSHIATAEPLDPVSALAYSCNNYFARFAARLKPHDFVRTLTSFGLTSSTKLTASELTAQVTLPKNVGQLQLLALGEAGIRVTVLEIAAAYRRLASIQREGGARTQQLSLVFNGLSAATAYGTARLARPPSIAVAGKTGTATEHANGRTHAWFAGYAPAEHPELIVVVFLETGSGGGDAAPVARQVFATI